MTVFLTTLMLFLIALALHLVVWKARLPKYHTRALLFLFALVLLLWLATVAIPLMSWPKLLHTCLFYTSLSLSYVVTYSALEADSPTLSLIRHLHKAGADGISAEEVRLFLEARPFIKARLNALMHDGLVAEKECRYFVASKGSPFFRVILRFRRLYGTIEEGG